MGVGVIGGGGCVCEVWRVNCEWRLKGLKRRGRLYERESKKWSARVIERESKGRRRPAWFIYFFSFLTRTGSVRVGRFRHTKTGNRTEPDIFLNILTGSIGFFIGSVFSVNFFPVFSVKSVFRFFCSPLATIQPWWSIYKRRTMWKKTRLRIYIDNEWSNLTARKRLMHLFNNAGTAHLLGRVKYAPTTFQIKNKKNNMKILKHPHDPLNYKPYPCKFQYRNV